MSTSQQLRHVGDTEVALAATLVRPDGTVVDLTGLTVKFTMIDSDGADVIAETETGVTVTDADSGEVQYTFSSGDVDTAGTYYAYFIVFDGTGNRDTFPVRQRELRISIQAD
jgi:hypothetical protein